MRRMCRRLLAHLVTLVMDLVLHSQDTSTLVDNRMPTHTPLLKVPCIVCCPIHVGDEESQKLNATLGVMSQLLPMTHWH